MMSSCYYLAIISHRSDDTVYLAQHAFYMRKVTPHRLSSCLTFTVCFRPKALRCFEEGYRKASGVFSQLAHFTGNPTGLLVTGVNVHYFLTCNTRLLARSVTQFARLVCFAAALFMNNSESPLHQRTDHRAQSSPYINFYQVLS